MRRVRQATRLSREEEANQILRMFDGQSVHEIMAMLERQFIVLHNRAQVLLGLSGVVITTTGFSGRLIAGTNRLAQIFIIAGVSLSLAAAAVVVGGVLHLWWLTQHPFQNTDKWLHSCLEYRDRKTRFYRLGIVLLLIGLTLYVAAIAVMLLHPAAAAVPAGR